MELITLSNGVRVVEINREEASNEAFDLEVEAGTRLGVRVSVEDQIETDAGRCRYPVVGTTITLHLTSDGMGNEATEADYDAFVAFVCRHIDEAAGQEVDVDAARWGSPGNDRVTGVDRDVAAKINEAAQDLWNRWCSEGAPKA